MPDALNHTFHAPPTACIRSERDLIVPCPSLFDNAPQSTCSQRVRFVPTAGVPIGSSKKQQLTVLAVQPMLVADAAVRLRGET
jgi:hypothetical protein